MKRACCLYIVPVKNYFNETEHELLSQKGICYSFAAQQGWSIAREFTGVDKIGKYALYDIKTNIREAVNNNEFDVLLLSSYKLVRLHGSKLIYNTKGSIHIGYCLLWCISRLYFHSTICFFHKYSQGGDKT